jgi:ubiquinone/menaquinone biosynthesis C-methylase UbiE
MTPLDRKKHWENIYNTKDSTEVSWYQSTPETSLMYIKALKLPLSASIIDIGGGDSFLVDYLLQEGYQNITVLDISEAALEKTKKRLGNLADKVTWIATDITAFAPNTTFDLWHDRAAFHFLTQEEDIEKYVQIASRVIKPSKYLIVGTFSDQGPTKCSGIPIKQYTAAQLQQTFGENFKPNHTHNTSHKTPFGTLQEFVFCNFTKK